MGGADDEDPVVVVDFRWSVASRVEIDIKDRVIDGCLCIYDFGGFGDSGREGQHSFVLWKTMD